VLTQTHVASVKVHRVELAAHVRIQADMLEVGLTAEEVSVEERSVEESVEEESVGF